MYTGLPAKYYEYLVGMENGSAIMKYGAHIKTWTHSQFVALCAGNDPLAPPPLADEAVPLDPEVDPEPVERLGDDDDNLAIVLPQPPEVQMWEPENLRVVPFLQLPDGSKPSIHYDNCSHPSGNPRMWARCSHTAHEITGRRCEKWRFLKDFFSDKECAVWLCAWSMSPERAADMEEHRVLDPVDSNFIVAARHYLGNR